MRDRLKFIGSALLLLPFLRSLFPRTAWASDVERARQLNKEGARLVEQGEYLEAMDRFKQMLGASRDQEYGKGVATFYLGRCHLEIADYDVALKYLDQAERIFVRLGKEHEKATVLQTKARLFAERSQYKKSLTLYQSSAELLTKFRDKGALFDLFNSSGAIHAYMGLFDKCLKCLSVANTLLPSKIDSRKVALLSNNTGMAHLGRQNYRTATAAFDKAMGEFKKVGDTKGIATVLNNMGHIHESRSDYPRALEAQNKSLQLAREIHDARGEAIALNNLGNVYLRTGKYKEALAAYEESLSITEKRGISQFVADTLNNIGLVRVIQGDYAAATRCFERSYTIFEEVGSLLGRAWSLHNLSCILRDQGRLKDSLKCARKALWLAETTGSRRARATVLLRRGRLYEYLGAFDGALTSFQEAERIQKDIGDAYFRSDSLADIATEHARRGIFETAEKGYQQAVALRSGIGSPRAQILCKFALFFVEKPQYADNRDDRQNNPEPMAVDRGGDLQMAAKYIKEAEEVMEPENVHGRLLLEYLKAKYRLEQDPQGSVSEFTKLQAMAHSLNIRKYGFLSSVGQGLAYERLEQWAAAKKAFTEAEGYVEKVERDLPKDERATFLQGEQILGIRNELPSEALARIREKEDKKKSSRNPIRKSLPRFTA